MHAVSFIQYDEISGFANTTKFPPTNFWRRNFRLPWEVTIFRFGRVSALLIFQPRSSYSIFKYSLSSVFFYIDKVELIRFTSSTAWNRKHFML